MVAVTIGGPKTNGSYGAYYLNDTNELLNVSSPTIGTNTIEFGIINPTLTSSNILSAMIMCNSSYKSTTGYVGATVNRYFKNKDNTLIDTTHNLMFFALEFDVNTWTTTTGTAIKAAIDDFSYYNEQTPTETELGITDIEKAVGFEAELKVKTKMM